MSTDERQEAQAFHLTTGSAKVSYSGANQEPAEPNRPTAQESIKNHRVTGLNVGS